MRFIEKLISENKIMTAMTLFPGKNRGDVLRILEKGLKKKMGLYVVFAALIALVFVGLDLKTDHDSVNLYSVERSDVNGVEKTVEVRIGSADNWSEETLHISPYEMSDAEIDTMHPEICSLLDVQLLNGNTSFDSICSDLLLPEELEDYPVVIDWTSDRPDILTRRGEVNNIELTDAVTVLLRGKISYGEEFRIYERLITVVPPERDEFGRAALSGVRELRRLEKEGRNERIFSIPENLEGLEVVRPEKRRLSLSAIGVSAGIIIILYAYSNYFSSMTAKRKRRLEKAGKDYKNFVSELTLLLSAGMTLRLAWRKLATDYSKGNEKKSLLAQNLAVSERELGNGELEQVVYERFGERMENIAYQRLSQILNQQVTKGVNDLNATLTAELKEVVAKERESIKIKGEEAGTKLLLPMVGILIIVFAVLLMPAFTTF